MITCSNNLFTDIYYIMFQIKIPVTLVCFIFSVCFLAWMIYSPSRIIPFYVLSAEHGVLRKVESAPRLYIKHIWHVI